MTNAARVSGDCGKFSVSSARSERRGVVIVAIIIMLLLISLIIVGMVLVGGRDQEITVQRLNTTRSFYAAEAGMHMAIREMMTNADCDGDGTIGSISDDANEANDPALGSAKLCVNSTIMGTSTALTSSGRAGDTSRKIVAEMPVTATGTIGYSQVFTQRFVANMQVGTRVTVPIPFTTTSITAYVGGPQSQLMRYAIYSDLAGEPGALLVQSPAEPIGSVTMHWHTIAVPSTTLSAGTYWFCLAFNQSNMYYAYEETGGQTRYNNHDAVTNGFNNPWGVSTVSNQRRVSIYANNMQLSDGPLTFSSDSEYHNANPATTGRFRDLTQPTLILRGNDVSSNSTKYSALNFTSAGFVSDAVTLYDSLPADGAPTIFVGNSLQISGDVLVTGNGTNGIQTIGFGALVSQTAGQEGIAIVLSQQGSNDVLRLYRLPQNGNIDVTTPLATAAAIYAVDKDKWYRLQVDVITSTDELYVFGRLFVHYVAANPNSQVYYPIAIISLAYSSPMSALSGLQTSGQVAIVFDNTASKGKGSLTNFRVDSSSTTNVSFSMGSWTEAQP